VFARNGSGNHQAKNEQGGKNPTGLSPRSRKACHSISTALLKSVPKIGTQSTMKSSGKTMHEIHTLRELCIIHIRCTNNSGYVPKRGIQGAGKLSPTTPDPERDQTS
jgi:hypothetical protein